MVSTPYVWQSLPLGVEGLEFGAGLQRAIALCRDGNDEPLYRTYRGGHLNVPNCAHTIDTYSLSSE